MSESTDPRPLAPFDGYGLVLVDPDAGINYNLRRSPSVVDMAAWHHPWRGYMELAHTVTPRAWPKLSAAGYRNLYDVSRASDEDLLAIKGVGPGTITALRRRIAELEVEHPLETPAGMISFAYYVRRSEGRRA